MRRLIIVIALGIGTLFGSVATVIATTTEDAARTGLNDCLITQEAQQLGVSVSVIPLTALSCYHYLVSIGKAP